MQNNSRGTSRPSFIDMIKDPDAGRVAYYNEPNDLMGALHLRICGEPVNEAGDLSQEKVLRIIEGFAEEQDASKDKLTVATHSPDAT